MAKRRTESFSAIPVSSLESQGQSCLNDTVSKHRKGKQLCAKGSDSGSYNSGRNHNQPWQLRKGPGYRRNSSVSTRTRAQTKQKTLFRTGGSRRVTRLQQKGRQQQGDLVKDSASLCCSSTPSTSTVAASSILPTQGCSTSRLREKRKVETSATSSSGSSREKHLSEAEDENGNASCSCNRTVHAPAEEDQIDPDNDHYSIDDRAEDSIDNEDVDNEQSDNNAESNDNASSADLEDTVSDDDDDDDDEDDVLSDEGEDCAEESCRCTSNWSCGGHSGLKRPGSCTALTRPRVGCKRSLSCAGKVTDDDDGPSAKKICRPGYRNWQSSQPSIGSGSGSSSAVGKAARHRIPSIEHPPPKFQQWLDTFKSWDNAERLMALDNLIALCEPSQVRHMMHVIEPQFQRDFISLLPKELALNVLSFLEPKDLLQAAQTCRYWQVLCEDNLLWKEKCREEGIDETLVYGTRLRRRPGLRNPCKALYMRQSRIEHNWRQGLSRTPKILKGHDDHVITCLEFCGQRIVSGSDDNTLRVWSVVTGKCLRNLVGHTGGVWSSQMAGNIIISGSTDRSLKVWNADTGVCKHTLFGHTSTVRCMSLCGNKVVSGSRDATLRVWNIETGQCLHVLLGHVAAVRCVQYDGRRVVSGAYDYTVRIWDPKTETCLHTLQGHTNRVYSLQFDGVHIVSGSLDTSIRVWDVETGACLHTLIGHQSLTSGLELKDNTLVSGNADSTVKVWDITTGHCLQTLQGPNKHQSAVTCLQFNKNFVITSSDDGTVKIWDLKTGEFLRNLVSLDSGGSGGVVWRLRCNNTKLVCAVGSRNGTEETKLMVLDFDVEDKKVS